MSKRLLAVTCGLIAILVASCVHRVPASEMMGLTAWLEPLDTGDGLLLRVRNEGGHAVEITGVSLSSCTNVADCVCQGRTRDHLIDSNQTHDLCVIRPEDASAPMDFRWQWTSSRPYPSDWERAWASSAELSVRDTVRSR